MSVGFYTDLWDTAVSPYTIFGPLCLVISFSLLVEGMGDWKRHQNDTTMNNAPCVVLHRISRNDWDMDAMDETFVAHQQRTSEENDDSGILDASHSSGVDASSTLAISKRKRISKKKRKKRNNMDLSARFDVSENNNASHQLFEDPTPGMPAATSERMKKSAERFSKKFGRGVEIHRDREINGGRDITVPLLPSILEDDGASHGAFDGDTVEPATVNAQNNFQATAQSKICFRSVPRRDIRQGQLVLIRNREMVPADIILMASSGDHGSAYIETSSIDGETNLKLRSRPAIPPAIVKQMKQWRRLEEQVRRGETSCRGSTSHNETILEDGGGESDEESSGDARSSQEEDGCNDPANDAIFCKQESLDQAVKRVTCSSTLGNSRGLSITEHPMYKEQMEIEAQHKALKSIPRRRSQGLQLINQLQSQWQMRRSDSGQNVHLINTSTTPFGGGISNFGMSIRNLQSHDSEKEKVLAAVKIPHNHYVTSLTSEPPNAYVHTFSGKLTLPTTSPFVSNNESSVATKKKRKPAVAFAGSSDTSLDDNDKTLEKPFADVSLDAENMLLRGAVLRNTEWAIGLVVFTGTDTKLVQNSFETPSKLSQLDVIMNWTVVAILCILGLVNAILASLFIVDHRRNFDQLWYLGYHKAGPVETANGAQPFPWPYLPDLPAPEWETSHQNWLQMFFLFLTLLNNVIPMSLYVTVEFLTAIHQFLINVDQGMYDDTTNTRAIARSTNVTDLGRVQYIFSDKTGMLVKDVSGMLSFSFACLSFLTASTLSTRNVNSKRYEIQEMQC